MKPIIGRILNLAELLDIRQSGNTYNPCHLVIDLDGDLETYEWLKALKDSIPVDEQGRIFRNDLTPEVTITPTENYMGKS